MKKIMIGLLATVFASNAFAIASFEFGSTWWFPRYDAAVDGFSPVIDPANLQGQGQTFAANWDLDNDFAIGAYFETVDMGDGQGNTWAFRTEQITITKGVVKNATIGMRFGTFHDTFNWWPTNGFNGVVTDVVGSVTIMTGAMDQVSGSLKATFGARFARESEYANNWTAAVDYGGYILGVSVGVGI